MALGRSNEARVVLTGEDRTAAAFRSAERGLKGLQTSARVVSGVLAGALGGVGASVALASLAGAVRATATDFDALIKSADAIGETTEALSGLQYAARLNSIENKEFSRGLGVLTKRLDEARRGSGEAARGFAALKLNPGDYNKGSEALLGIADAFSKLPANANRALIAQQLFGEELGGRFVPLLLQGRVGISALTDEAERYNRVVGREAAEASVRFNDELTRLSEQATGLRDVLAGPVIGYLAEFLEVTRALADGPGALSGSLSATIKGLVEFGEIGTVNTTLATLNDQLAFSKNRIEEFEKVLSRGRLKEDAKEALSSKIGALQKDLEVLERTRDRLIEIQQRGLGEAFGIGSEKTGTGNGAVDTAAADAARKAAEAIARAAETRRKAGEALVAQQIRQLVSTQQLTAVQQLEVDLALSGDKISSEYIARARALAQLTDKQRERLEIETRMQAEMDGFVEKQLKRNEQLDRERDSYLDILDPMREYARQAKIIDELVARGDLTPRQAIALKDKFKDDAAGVRDIGAAARETESALQSMNTIFVSAADKALDMFLGFDTQARSAGRSAADLNERIAELEGNLASAKTPQAVSYFRQELQAAKGDTEALGEEVNKLGELIRSVFRDSIQTLFRKKIVEPFIDSFIGGFGGAAPIENHNDSFVPSSSFRASKAGASTIGTLNISAGVSQAMVTDAVSKGMKAVGYGYAERERRVGY